MTLTFRIKFRWQYMKLKENVCIRIPNFTLELDGGQCQPYTKNMIATLRNVNTMINERH